MLVGDRGELKSFVKGKTCIAIWNMDILHFHGWFMVFNATFNKISVISRRSVLLVEEIGVPWEKPLTCHKSLTNIYHIMLWW